MDSGIFSWSFLLLIPSLFEDKEVKAPSREGKNGFDPQLCLPVRGLGICHNFRAVLEVTREGTLENGNSGYSPGNLRLVLFMVMKKTRGLNEFQSLGPFRTNSMPAVPPPHHPSLSHNRTTLGKNTNCDEVEWKPVPAMLI